MGSLLADNLKELADLRHAFFMRGDDGRDLPFHDYCRLAALHMGVVPNRLMLCDQTHSADCVTVVGPWNAAPPQADAMATNVPGLALAIKTADCVPVLFADKSSKVIGAAHAGWRGALGGVLENTIKVMEELGANRTSLCAAIGPCIWQMSYEVGPEFPAPFLAEDPAHERFFRLSGKDGHHFFDLPGYVKTKLQALGVRDVEASPADTYADKERFYSYRRENDQGRQLSIIAMTA